MRHIKIFENYNKSCYIIDNDEFNDLCNSPVVNPDRSGGTNFREKENLYSISLDMLKQLVEVQFNSIFGEKKLKKSNKHFDSRYGSLRDVELEYSSIKNNKYINVNIVELKDEINKWINVSV